MDKRKTSAEAGERRSIALESIFQMAGLFESLADFAMRLDHHDTLPECALLRAIAARGSQLSEAAMHALSEHMNEAQLGDAQRTVTAGSTLEHDESATIGDRFLRSRDDAIAMIRGGSHVE